LTEPTQPRPYPSTPYDLEAAPSRSATVARWVRILGYFLLPPSIVFALVIAGNAGDPNAAGRAIGQLLGPIFIAFMAAWVLLRTRTSIRIGHFWPWMFVALAVIVFIIRAVPPPETARRTIESYVEPRAGYTFEQDPQQEAQLRRAMTDAGLGSDDVEDVAIYYVIQGDVVVAAVELFTTPPTLAASERHWENVAAGFGENGEMSTITIAGEEVTRVTRDGLTGLFWHVDNLGVFLFSDSLTELENVVTALRNAETDD
jgi:hypothetical protein